MPLGKAWAIARAWILWGQRQLHLEPLVYQRLSSPKVRPLPHSTTAHPHPPSPPSSTSAFTATLAAAIATTIATAVSAPPSAEATKSMDGFDLVSKERGAPVWPFLGR